MAELLMPAVLILFGASLLWDPTSKPSRRDFDLNVWDITALLGGRDRPIYARIAGCICIAAGLVLGGFMIWLDFLRD